jgi:hypothetical protein
MYSSDLNNPAAYRFYTFQVAHKKIRRREQGDCIEEKIAGTGFYSVVENCVCVCTLASCEQFAKGLFLSGKLPYWSAVCRKRVKSSHLPSTILLFAAPYIYNARLYKCKN